MPRYLRLVVQAGEGWVQMEAGLQFYPAQGVGLRPFRPSNCGFLVDWSDRMKREFAGTPVKNVRLSLPGSDSESRAEFVVTKNGIESGGVYWLSASLVATLDAQASAILNVDLLPDIPRDELLQRLKAPKGKQSRSTYLRKKTGLTGVKLALLYEFAARETFDDVEALVKAIKALPIRISAIAPMDEAISTSGGVRWAELDANMMVQRLPGVFCAGEMLDWDAPTGGYLLTACLATGRAAGEGASRWLNSESS